MVARAKRLHYILFHSEGALLEFFLAVWSILWALWLLSPFWDAFAGPAFTVMDEIAPTWAWGLAMLLLGSLKIWTIVSQQHRAKRVVFLATLFVWTCVALSFIAAAPYAPGSAFYGLVCATNAFCIWRDGGT